MSGGPSARAGFRYQDWCVIYIFLKTLNEEENGFLHVICENDKLDFETLFEGSFRGYQAKLNSRTVSAKDINSIFLFYLGYLNTVVREADQSELIFFFENKINKPAIDHLFNKLNFPSIPTKRQHKTFEKYVLSALMSVNIPTLKTRFLTFDRPSVEKLVWEESEKILKKLYKQDINNILLENLINALKVKVEALSSERDIKLRMLYKKDLIDICTRLIAPAISGTGKIALPPDPEYGSILGSVNKAEIPKANISDFYNNDQHV